MSTTAKVAIGVAAVAIVYMVVRARAAANAANSYTTGYGPPAPAPYAPPPAAPPPTVIGTYGPTVQERSGRGAF